MQPIEVADETDGSTVFDGAQVLDCEHQDSGRAFNSSNVVCGQDCLKNIYHFDWKNFFFHTNKIHSEFTVIMQIILKLLLYPRGVHAKTDYQ